MKEKIEYHKILIWKSTMKPLRMIHALTGESKVKIIDRLIGKELEIINSNSYENS